MRDGPDGVETLLLLRPVASEFAPAALVFPGGRIDPEDASDAWDDLADLTEDQAAKLTAGATPAGIQPRAFLVAAVREAFEETSVLLGADGLDPEWALEASGRVHRGEATFAGVIGAAGLRLRLREIVYFARWITPVIVPRRFDTAFFAAAMPPGPPAIAAAGEIESLEWVTPEKALNYPMWMDRKVASIMPPTQSALHALSGYPTVEAALDGLKQKRDLTPVLPQLTAKVDDQGLPDVTILVPGDPDYDQGA